MSIIRIREIDVNDFELEYNVIRHPARSSSPLTELNTRDALSAIRYQLDEIHGSIKGLDAQKRVPIPNAPNAPNAEPLEYDYLLMLEREGDETCRVKDGNRLVTVKVRQILSAIESESQHKESGNRVTNIYIGGDVKDSNILAGDENEVKK